MDGKTGAPIEPNNIINEADRLGIFMFDHLIIEDVVPIEVLKEIAALIGHPEKGKAASLGRSSINSLKDRDKDCLYEYKEIELATIVEPATALSPIGADSPTDRLIVAYAQRLVDCGYHSVFIATKDGGIISDILDMRKATGCKIYCIGDSTKTYTDTLAGILTPPVAERQAAERQRAEQAATQAGQQAAAYAAQQAADREQAAARERRKDLVYSIWNGFLVLTMLVGLGLGAALLWVMLTSSIEGFIIGAIVITVLLRLMYGK